MVMIAFIASLESFENPSSVYLMAEDDGNLRRLNDESRGDWLIWSLGGKRSRSTFRRLEASGRWYCLYQA
jgi:hypothetical protein